MRGEKPVPESSPPPRASLWLAVGATAVFALGLAAASPGQAVSLQWHTQVSDADFFVKGGPSDLLPSAMAAGLYNGDNRSDLVFCSATNSTCGLYYGRSYASGGFDLGDPDILFVGPGGAFGAAASFLGDLNGDGFEDLGIGGPGAVGEGGVQGGGSLWIFFGRNDSFRGAVGFYDAATTVFGADPSGALGTAAAAAGDVDRDGYGDFWVSATNATDASLRVGEVLLYRGRASWPTELYRSGAALRLTGVVQGGDFGRVLLGRIDLNGDGRFDLATATSKYRDLSNVSVGAAFAFIGPLPTDGRTVNATRANITFWGDANAPSLGSSLAFAVNFTKEKGRMLMIGAPAYTNNTSTGGSLHLFKIQLTACCQNLHRWDAASLLYTAEANDQAGLAAASGGDIDGDGIIDLLVGAPSAEVGSRTDAGRVFIVYGNDTSRQPYLLTDRQIGLEGRANSTYLGNQLVLADFNGDGRADLIVSSPGENKKAPLSGVAYGFLGRPRNRAPVIYLNFTGNLTEGSLIEVQANASDIDDDRLTWEWMGSTDGKAHAIEPLLAVTYVDEGEYAISLAIFDGTLWGIAYLTLKVLNAPPICDVVPIEGFVEGQAGELRLNASDPGILDKWSITWSGPDGFLVGGSRAVYEPPRGEVFLVNATIADEDGGVGNCSMLVPVRNVAPTVVIYGPTVVFEGDTAIYTTAIEDPGIEDRFFHNWTTPHGAENGTHLVFRAMAPGNILVQVIVGDLDGGQTLASLGVQVRGVPPDAALMPIPPSTEGDDIVIEVRQYSGGEFDPMTISWSICQFGSVEGNTYRITHAESGHFCVEIIVFDDDFDSLTFSTSFEVANRPPLEGIRARPPAPYREGQSVTLDAIVGAWETTPTAYIDYNWTIDDEVVSRTRSMSFIATAGRHKVAVDATDKDGEVSHFFLVVTVENSPPALHIAGREDLAPGAIGVWTAQATDEGGRPVTLSWDVDGVHVTDGPELQWGTEAQGTYIVRVTATDSGGATSVASMLVSVSPPPAQSAGIDIRWLAVPLGAAAAFAAGIILGAMVIGRIRAQKPRDDEAPVPVYTRSEPPQALPPMGPTPPRPPKGRWL